MDFVKLITKENIFHNLKFDSKESVFKEVAKAAKQSSILSDYSEKDILNALSKREKLGSTGFAKGLAIPHCKLKGISDFVIGLITTNDGIDFNSLDGQPTKLIIFIIAPERERNQHIHLLSKISRFFNSANKINALLDLKNKEEIYESISKAYQNITSNNDNLIDYCSIQVSIQDEEKFMDIIEIFAELDDCSVSVTNANDLGYYIHSLPLYASFWNNTETQSHQTINAVIKKSLSNEIIRQIQNITGDLNKNPGVMVILQDLVYKCGSLNI